MKIKHHDNLKLKGKTVIALGSANNNRITVCPADKIQTSESRRGNSFEAMVSELAR